MSRVLAEDVLDQISDTAAAFGLLCSEAKSLYDLLLVWRRRPVTAIVIVNGNRSNGMPTNIPDDDTFQAQVQFEDRFQNVVPEPAAVQWLIVNDADDNTSNVAAITPETATDEVADGTIQQGSGAFRIKAVSAGLVGYSDVFNIVPGAASVGIVNVVMQPATQNPTP